MDQQEQGVSPRIGRDGKDAERREQTDRAVHDIIERECRERHEKTMQLRRMRLERT